MQIEPYEKHFGRANRKPFQFSLRALMVLTAFCAVVAAVFSRWSLSGIFALLVALALFQIARGIWTRRVDRVLGGACALGVIAIAVPPFSVAVWDGSVTVPLKFIIVDRASARALPGATVRLRDIEWEPAPLQATPGERGSQVTADSNGNCTLTQVFWTSGRESLLENYGNVNFGKQYLVQVTASGHRPYQMRLYKLIGERRDVKDPNPAPITIELAADPATN